MAALDITFGFIIIGIGVIVLFFVITCYNGLISLRNNIDKAWANIDVLLKKRLDLIPNLVELVRGYASYEQGVLEEITKIRASAMQARGSEAVSASLGSVFALAENYPNLKASENFLHLQKEFSLIETQIAQRREFYNDSVLLYNTNIKTIPSVYLANWLNYSSKEYFRVDGDVGTPLKITIEVPQKIV